VDLVTVVWYDRAYLAAYPAFFACSNKILAPYKKLIANPFINHPSFLDAHTDWQFRFVAKWVLNKSWFGFHQIEELRSRLTYDCYDCYQMLWWVSLIVHFFPMTRIRRDEMCQMRIVKAEEKFRRQQRSPKHLCPLESREEKLGQGGKKTIRICGN
jgi:hypothetical protein